MGSGGGGASVVLVGMVGSSAVVGEGCGGSVVG